GVDPLDRAGPLGAALGLDAVLDAALEEDLHPDAHAEHRAPAGQPAADDPLAAHGPQPVHAGRVRADAGHEQAVRLDRSVEVGGDGHLDALPRDGAFGGADVAGAVVEDRDVLHRWSAHFQRSTPAAMAIAAHTPRIPIRTFGRPCLAKEITPPIRNRPRKIRNAAA